jgi:Bacterial Ig-like domain (group 1)
MARFLTCSLSPALALLVACGGSGLTLPADDAPTSLRAVSGSDQEATVGSELRNPLVARLTDAAGEPIAGATVVFETDVPEARVEPSSDTTDLNGRASVRVRLGSVPGVQTFEARLSGGAADLRATFGPTALARPEDGDGDGDGQGRGGGGGGGGGGDRDDDD